MPRLWRATNETRERVDDFERIPALGVVRIAATTLVKLAEDDDAPAPAAFANSSARQAVSSARLGALVHQALQRAISDPNTLATDSRAPEVVRMCEGILAQPGVRSAIEAGTPLFEVPFSLRDSAGQIVRGSIDCLVMGEQVTVLEFKTGAPQPEHRQQLELYVQAVTAMVPQRKVEGLLVYG